jgi:type IX secretion system PorP/SprF family membrane protein
MFNGLAINPAYAGSHNSLDLSVLSRFQSVGLEGAPRTQTFTGHTGIMDKKIGLGFLVINDEIGVTQQTGFYLSYAYHIRFSGSTLSLGLQGGGTMVDAQYSQLLIRQPGDPILGDDVKGFKPNFGAGIYYYSDHFYAGISVPQLLDAGEKNITQLQPLIVTSGIVFTLNPALKLKPNILFRVIDQKPVEFNYNMNLLIHEVLWIGVSYRPSNSANVILELQLTEKLRFGYAYDFGINDLSKATSGSHEFMLNFQLRKSKRGVVNPRYF